MPKKKKKGYGVKGRVHAMRYGSPKSKRYWKKK